MRKFIERLGFYFYFVINKSRKLFYKIWPLSIFLNLLSRLDLYLNKKFKSIRISNLKDFIYSRFTLFDNVDPILVQSSEFDIEANFIIKNSAKKWRKFSLIVVIFSFILFGFQKCSNNKDNSPNSKSFGGYIAKISINEAIKYDEEIYESLRQIRDNNSIKAVILKINSPGGYVTPSETIYNLVRQIDAKKPVIVSMQDVAASGGYMVALGARFIFAMHTTVTGSIGVIGQTFEAEELAKKIGVKVNYIKSHSIKGGPQLFEKLSKESFEVEKKHLMEIYVIFRNLVSERRNIKGRKLDEVANGSIFIGDKALQYGLIDAIGDEESAERFLYENNLVEKGLLVKKINIQDKSKDSGFMTKFRNFLTNNILSYIVGDIFKF